MIVTGFCGRHPKDVRYCFMLKAAEADASRVCPKKVIATVMRLRS